MNDRVLPEIHLILCNRCGACVLLCPTHALEMGPEGSLHRPPGGLRVLCHL
jgi:formate hydrogenlyase subunit 6/NADH:ubiquinone oxidoreductase subunit I